MGGDLGRLQVHKRDVVVFLKGHNCDVVVVDGHVLGLGIGPVEGGNAGEVHATGLPSGRRTGHINNHQRTSRQLRQCTAV